MKELIIDHVEFEIINKIAEGGMGAVYKALQKGVRGFAKTVAIKTILEEFARDSKFVEDFISEAMLVANLIHENIVQIYQLGKYSGDYFFVLEYVDGISLFDMMDFHKRAGRRLPVPLAVFIASRVARGLAYAHARKNHEGEPMNIIHCDVCTHNIMINTEGVPKLTDFGIARASSRKREDAGLSGKLPFIAPEQLNLGKEIDFHVDIYSLGVVLFCMITGQYPRRIDQTMREVIDNVRENNIMWEYLPSDIDEDLIVILHRMLDVDPAKRYADTAALARELEFYIYKDGYGPTIVSLAEYMKKTLPGLFLEEFLGDSGKTFSGMADSDTEAFMLEKTQVMRRDAD